jgi:hypothetical protein
MMVQFLCDQICNMLFFLARRSYYFPQVILKGAMEKLKSCQLEHLEKIFKRIVESFWIHRIYGILTITKQNWNYKNCYFVAVFSMIAKLTIVEPRKLIMMSLL